MGDASDAAELDVFMRSAKGNRRSGCRSSILRPFARNTEAWATACMPIPRRSKGARQMSNRLSIDTVRVTFLKSATSKGHDLHGFWIGDDYEDFQVLDFASTEEVPSTIEEVLHYLCEENPRAYELVCEHVANYKGARFNGTYLEAEQLRPILERCEEEDAPKPEAVEHEVKSTAAKANEV